MIGKGHRRECAPDGGDLGDVAVVTVKPDALDPLVLGTLGVQSSLLSKDMRSSSSPQMRWVCPDISLALRHTARLAGLGRSDTRPGSETCVLTGGVKASMSMS
jgi:hypothetical protein